MRARGGAISLAHCWAHARREIKEALAGAPRTGAWLLGQIQVMYEIERGLREAKAGSVLREAVRSSQTRMIVDRVFKAMIRLRARELPGNAMAKALDYCLERREGLSRFLGDGRIEIDSNLVNAARGINEIMPRPVLCRVTSWDCAFPRRTKHHQLLGAA